MRFALPQGQAKILREPSDPGSGRPSNFAGGSEKIKPFRRLLNSPRAPLWQPPLATWNIRFLPNMGEDRGTRYRPECAEQGRQLVELPPLFVFQRRLREPSACVLCYCAALVSSASSARSSGIWMLCGQWDAQAPQPTQSAGVPLDRTPGSLVSAHSPLTL